MQVFALKVLLQVISCFALLVKRFENFLKNYNHFSIRACILQERNLRGKK